MPRTSAETQLLDSKKYAKLYPDYQNQMKQLITKFKIVDSPEYGDKVTFEQNKTSVRHRWFEYKQGFSPSLIDLIISETSPLPENVILDPFTGVGTTNLVAQQFGYRSIGFDVNPVAAFAAKVKTTHYVPHDIQEITQQISQFKPIMTERPILYRLILNSFDPKVLDQLWHIKGFFEQIKNQYVADFFKLAYLSILEAVSKRIKDGNGIKIAKKKTPILDVYTFFLAQSQSMLADIHISNPNITVSIVNSSLLIPEQFSVIQSLPVGLVVFSPPYANCFDYCEVYKLEIWMGEFVHEQKDFIQYRSIAMRSHVNSRFNHIFNHTNPMVDTIAEVISCFNIWNRHIPDMLRGYFDDMNLLLSQLFSVMTSGAKCFIIVANSGYRGILVPTDLLIADIAKKIGFSVREIRIARKIRASSQQMDALYKIDASLMRESIIILEKIGA